MERRFESALRRFPGSFAIAFSKTCDTLTANAGNLYFSLAGIASG